MLNSDKSTIADRTAESGLARTMAALFGLAGLAVVWFACRYIVSHYEAGLMDAGLRPSPAARGMLVSSHFVARYFWWIAPILGALFLFPAKSRPAARGAAGQG